MRPSFIQILKALVTELPVVLAALQQQALLRVQRA
jgi:hypothetical protein